MSDVPTSRELRDRLEALAESTKRLIGQPGSTGLHAVDRLIRIEAWAHEQLPFRLGDAVTIRDDWTPSEESHSSWRTAVEDLRDTFGRVEDLIPPSTPRDEWYATVRYPESSRGGPILLTMPMSALS